MKVLENTKIKDICNRYPWTEEAEAELAEFRKKAVPMFAAEVAATTEVNYDKYGFPSEEEMNRQHEALVTESEKFERAFRENPIKVLEDQINYYIDFVNAFMDPKATDEQKEKIWPEYKDYSSEFIRERALKNKRYLEKEILALLEKFSTGYKQSLQDPKELKKIIDNAVRTRYPDNFIAPTDKVSNLAFAGELTGTNLQQLAMERRGSKKQITTLASIDFEKLNGSVQIKGRKELTPYDREVHDAIITIFIDGSNEYITPQMIYQVMTGNQEAKLNPKQAEAISESITKCMFSRVIIDASEESKAYGFESFKYDGNLISGERVTASLNGTVLECLHIVREPVLYEYANKKNQIGRFDIKLLNTPINKTEEIITLQGYLYRRILSMKGSSNLRKTIAYETVYNQINVTAASDGALRKKKSKVRGQIKDMLDYWKQENFIAGYCENKRGQEVYSVTIRL
ncbi:hypothetical protein [Eubacterium aggregans]|uniref:hypothetical protein n=1 Tax=Eubacterium aggregans TaxID=81409 RepID=UPI003F332792